MMINIFDLSAGMAGTKMLTERAHRDGSLARRSRSDGVSKVTDPVEDKPVTHESRSSSCKKSSGTPMKKLIEQEMSKEMESRQKPPSVIAKLMGLDALPPQQQSAPITQREMPEGKSIRGYNGCHEKTVAHDIRPSRTYARESREFKDVYEVSRQPLRPAHFKDEPFLRGRCRESPRDKRMTLVRQKFMEAKRLATNQKLLQSKEFQDALDVLSSNRDLFLKFLEEPNSLFSKYLREVPTSPLPSQTKRITVLKPSKSLDMDAGRRMEGCVPNVEEIDPDMYKPGWGSTFLHRRTESLPQPTRIVVLKPSPGKPNNAKALVTSPTISPASPQGEDLFEDTGVARGSRKMAKEITRQMRESFSSRREETLLSSVLSNGYTGDESSIYRSDDENMEDECGNISDSEFATPTSRNSWDCINRVDSPCSLSSLSRASCSSESSVIREAKKRLSERWVMLISNEISGEQRHARRSTSTLGEMLARTESKRKEESIASSSCLRDGSYGGDEDLNAAFSTSILGEMLAHTESKRKEESIASSSCLRDGSYGGDEDLNAAFSTVFNDKSSNENDGEQMAGSLQRSKSFPASSSTYGAARFDPDTSSSHAIKSMAPSMAKTKSGKSSFKGKVSSFLFLRSKKSSTEKSHSSKKVDALNGIQSFGDEASDICRNNLERSLHDFNMPRDTIPFETPDHDGQRVENSTAKVSPVVEKPRTFENASDNLGQPSPVSVLESVFQDDANPSISHRSERAISRSPPIESIARSLSWDGAYTERTISYPSKSSTDFLKADIQEHEREMFVQTLLSSAGLDDETPSTVFARWYSSESPLSSTLLDKFLERKEEAAKCREKRSNQRLLFDCVNVVLSEFGWSKMTDRCTYTAYCLQFPDGVPTASSVTKEVLKRLNEWLSDIEKVAARRAESGIHVVDYFVRRELDGNRWADMATLEMGEFRREIEGEVLEELVREALEDLIGCCK